MSNSADLVIADLIRNLRISVKSHEIAGQARNDEGIICSALGPPVREHPAFPARPIHRIILYK